ncbi:MAG: hypothetical protein HW373_1516 [Deltaproteobacteria bacterium]|nr:hypothetical protein [Deltaproteobacteria bacterium]
MLRLDDLFGLALGDLLPRLAFDAERGYRPGLETFDANLLTAFFADAILAGVEALQSFLHFENQFTFAVADEQDRIAIRFHRRPVRGVGKILVVIHGFDGLAGLRTDPLVEKTTKEIDIFFLHKYPSTYPATAARQVIISQ